MLATVRSPRVFRLPNKLTAAVCEALFHLKFEKCCPIPVGAAVWVVQPVTSTVEPVFQVAVGLFNFAAISALRKNSRVIQLCLVADIIAIIYFSLALTLETALPLIPAALIALIIACAASAWALVITSREALF